VPTKTEKREFRLFTLIGFTATVIDYAVLNILTLLFGVPILGANVISSSLSSIYSYILNRKVVFDSIAHGERRSFLLYLGSIVVSIAVIQSGVIAVLGHGVTEDWYATFGVTGAWNDLLATNTAKVIAGVLSLWWNFYTQRRFVFRSNSAKHN